MKEIKIYLDQTDQTEKVQLYVDGFSEMEVLYFLEMAREMIKDKIKARSVIEIKKDE